MPFGGIDLGPRTVSTACRSRQRKNLWKHLYVSAAHGPTGAHVSLARETEMESERKRANLWANESIWLLCDATIVNNSWITFSCMSLSMTPSADIYDSVHVDSIVCAQTESACRRRLCGTTLHMAKANAFLVNDFHFACLFNKHRAGKLAVIDVQSCRAKIYTCNIRKIIIITQDKQTVAFFEITQRSCYLFIFMFRICYCRGTSPSHQLLLLSPKIIRNWYCRHSHSSRLEINEI